MNAVEIEQALADLADAPFDREEFPFAFLEAFGNKETTIKRLRSGNTNASDVENGILQRLHLHLATCDEGMVEQTLNALRQSPKTASAKVKYIIATDGISFSAEYLVTGDILACNYPDFAGNFPFFLPLAGITTVREITNSKIDIQASNRLNRLYVELLKTNEGWTTEERRHDMNQFMARLIFCFFAEDTGIFNGDDLFTATLEQMSDAKSGNTDQVLAELFRAMATPIENRAAANLRPWADAFPYVNGGMFDESCPIPKFSNIARSYLLRVGKLDWQDINPDIFGSMIQAVADDGERGELGMHYTSVPNILKVLNPLFLDDLREKLEEAGDNPRKLLNLRKRIANIRVFDPACGSGNFLVIAYIQLREIEAEILKRRKETHDRSWIKLENFYGIEIKDFAVEVARLSLLIAEFQCDVRFIGQKEARALVLPLRKTGRVKRSNALRENWLEICPPATKPLLEEHDLGGPTGRLALESVNQSANLEVETYICGNPPYLGSTWQSKQQKDDLKQIFDKRTKNWKLLDYVAGWFMKAADYNISQKAAAAFVSTNSICQGQQVAILWPEIFKTGNKIHFAHTSFKWENLASNKAGVTVVIVGMSADIKSNNNIYTTTNDGDVNIQRTQSISAYLVSGQNIIIKKSSRALNNKNQMSFGNKPVDGGNLLLTKNEMENLKLSQHQKDRFTRRIFGSSEFIRGLERYCLWITDEDLKFALSLPQIKKRVDRVREIRLESRDKSANELSQRPHQMREMNIGLKHTIVLPSVSSENRNFLPVGLLDNRSTITNLAFALYDAPIWNMALIASRLHLVWISTVCGKMKTDFRYSNTLGWNTFPLPTLTEKHKEDLSRCAENILLAREIHFPASIADLYDPETMPENLRKAHDANDEVLERIYIGRRFKNDTERLEKLFDLYSKMIAKEEAQKIKAKAKKQKAS
ncbi:lactate dehydrogenase [Thalassospira sp. SN3W]|uniref:class I SAM-dependent DNA methyltransferase n=1 Tax=Thalassospira sp. SN3W TaxID=3035476 RepID=UPI00311B2F49